MGSPIVAVVHDLRTSQYAMALDREADIAVVAAKLGVDTARIVDVPVFGRGAAQANLYTVSQPWEDSNVVFVMPTRGRVRIEVWRAHDRLELPMNIKRCKIDAVGMEVGEAYDYLIDQSMKNQTCASWPWVVTYEEDNTPEPKAFKKLLEAIRHCPDCKQRIGNEEYCSLGHKAYDAIQALYWTKSDPPMPMAFGNPGKARDFATQDVVPKIEAEDPLDQLLEVNGVAMGFTLYRKSLFEKISKPRFRTVDYSENGKVVGQDIYFCLKAKEEAGARFAVHCGVKCGHIDTDTGEVW